MVRHATSVPKARTTFTLLAVVQLLVTTKISMKPESLSAVITQLGGAAAKVGALLMSRRESVAVAAATTRLNW
jgi:hypothetical protein